MALNTRVYPRHQVRLEIRFRSAASFRDAWAADISRGGVYIETQENLEPGQVVTLEVSLPGKAGTLEIPGRVVHHRAGLLAGIGIEFGELSPKNKKILDTYVDKLGLSSIQKS